MKKVDHKAKNNCSSNQEKQKRHDKVSFLKGIIILCCIITAVVLGSNIVIILLNAFNKNFNLSCEQNFVTDALAILGLIVTIWEGLNIYNIIERRDFDEIKHSSKEITNEIKKHKNDLEAFKKI